MKYINSILSSIGNTPLLKLNKVAKEVSASVFVKLEHLNPSGSYKDRMAISMIEAAEKGLTWNKRKLEPGGIIVDASAGNTAPALAFVCAAKGYKAKLFVYKPMLKGGGIRLKITGAYGPDISEAKLPSAYLSGEDLNHFLKLGSDRTHVIAGKMQAYELEKNDRNVVWVDQIYNKYNYIGHMSMAYELYDQLEGKIDAFGCSVGSGGALLGVLLGLYEKGIHPYSFGIIPFGSETYIDLKKEETKKDEKIERSKWVYELIERIGLKKWLSEKSIIEEMIEKGYPDTFFRITHEEARTMANRLCQEEGIYCGMSSGANVAVALKIAKRLGNNKNVVTTIVDRRDRYLGEYPDDIYIV
jgi:cysteine synthase